MKLLTKAIENKLRSNWIKNQEHMQATGGHTLDFKPALKIFNPYGSGTWLFTELSDDGDTLFGLCDLGQGEPELGYASLSELESVKVIGPLGFERDRFTNFDKTLSQYAEEARQKQAILV